VMMAFAARCWCTLVDNIGDGNERRQRIIMCVIDSLTNTYSTIDQSPIARSQTTLCVGSVNSQQYCHHPSLSSTSSLSSVKFTNKDVTKFETWIHQVMRKIIDIPECRSDLYPDVRL
jgi:hypothetical protein